MKKLWVGVVFCTVIGAVMGAQAGEVFYVFKDRNGKTLMLDHVPPDMKQRGYKIVNSNGVTLEVVAPSRPQRTPAPSPQFVGNELQAEDILLLQSYSSVHDIEAARDERLSQLSEIINSTEAHTQAFERNLTSMKERKEQLVASGLPVEKKLADDMAMVEGLIAKNHDYVEKKRAEHKEVSEQYQRDIRRFIEIRGPSGH